MNNHDIVNKLAAASIHLRMADTLCTNAGVIDEIRRALSIIQDVGEACGKELTKEQEV